MNGVRAGVINVEFIHVVVVAGRLSDVFCFVRCATQRAE